MLQYFTAKVLVIGEPCSKPVSPTWVHLSHELNTTPETTVHEYQLELFLLN